MDKFNINTASKKETAQLPPNANTNVQIVRKSKEVFSKLLHDIIHKESLTSCNNYKLTAQNFINNNYNNNNNVNASHDNLFTLIKKAFGIEGKAFLLKSKIEVTNSGYYLDDINSKTNYILTHYDWRNLYATMPSIKNNKSNIFATDKTPLTTLMEQITYKPNTLELNMDINEQNIGKYLQHKHQRQSNEGISDMSKLPSSILSLMQMYGDVIANANRTDVSNYLKYKKYN